MFGLSPVELIVIGSIAVLLFGSRLPSVARSMGKSVTEFKKGNRGIEEEMDVTSNDRRVSSYTEDREEPTVPKFVPPNSDPKDETVHHESLPSEAPPSELPSSESPPNESARGESSHGEAA